MSRQRRSSPIRHGNSDRERPNSDRNSDRGRPNSDRDDRDSDRERPFQDDRYNDDFIDNSGYDDEYANDKRSVRAVQKEKSKVPPLAGRAPLNGVRDAKKFQSGSAGAFVCVYVCMSIYLSFVCLSFCCV